MRRIVVPLALVGAAFFLFPSGEGLTARWKRLPSLSLASDALPKNLAIDTLRGEWAHLSQQDTVARTQPVADPFRLASAESDAPKAVRTASPSGPPPPRLWKATGRVGERAAVVSHPDGRVLVVTIGQAIDSASVVGIGPGGVELEDRGGKFVLRIP
ncbi:MAG: hypothetical protein IPK50_00565 [Fibrobacterota bacterium]|nr:hypothetical protein [Fibrobacterota bacterium]QQS05408.1 MAG: hypothetical protein IPK50_00565 [Fibrobacterota bacterium]